MFDTIPVPVKGQPARASWGAGITNRVNELGAMFPSRGLARDGLTGTGFAALPQNKRDRRAAVSAPPRQFQLRATVETRTNEDTEETEVRLKVDYFCLDPSNAVTWSGLAILTPSGQGTGPVQGWNNILTTEWADSLDEDVDFFVNVAIGLEREEDGSIRKLLRESGDTGWEVSDTGIEHIHYSESVYSFFRHAYKIGHVSASGNTAVVTQYYEGAITFLDLSDPGSGGGGGGSMPKGKRAPGRFEISGSEDEESGDIVASFVNPYFDVGGKTYEASVSSVSISGACILALKVNATGSSGVQPGATVEIYANLAALQAAQADRNYYISPLYELEAGGRVSCDFRTGPVMAMGEF